MTAMRSEALSIWEYTEGAEISRRASLAEANADAMLRTLTEIRLLPETTERSGS